MSIASENENPFASPQSEEAPVVSNPTPAWRDGELVVVAPDGELPRRCAKCGGEASGGLHYAYLPKPEPTNWGRLAIIVVIVIVVVPVLLGIFSNVTIPWPPWFGRIDAKQIAAVFVVSLLGSIALLLRYIALKRRPQSLRYSLCSRHNIANRIAKIGMSLMSTFWMIVIFIEPQLNLLDNTPFLMIVFVLCMLVILISTERFVFTPKEVVRRSNLVWLKGAGPAFRDSLPEFPHELAIKNGQEH